MQLIITDAWLIKSRAVHLSGTKLVVAMFLLALVLMLCAAGLYHWVFLKGAGGLARGRQPRSAGCER